MQENYHSQALFVVKRAELDGEVLHTGSGYAIGPHPGGGIQLTLGLTGLGIEVLFSREMVEGMLPRLLYYAAIQNIKLDLFDIIRRPGT